MTKYLCTNMRWKQTLGIEKVANYGESTVSPSDRQQCYAENPTSFISWWMTWLIFFTTKWLQPFLVKGCLYVNYWYGYLLIVIISYATEMQQKIVKKDIWNKMFCFICLFVAKKEKWESNLGKFPLVRLATILVYWYVPIGCCLPRDIRFSNFSCYQNLSYWTL